MLSKAVGHQNADFNQSRDGQHHHPEERACHSQECFSDRFHWRDYIVYLAAGEAAANNRFVTLLLLLRRETDGAACYYASMQEQPVRTRCLSPLPGWATRKSGAQCHSSIEISLENLDE
jgi:hypothetical protein